MQEDFLFAGVNSFPFVAGKNTAGINSGVNILKPSGIEDGIKKPFRELAIMMPA